MKLIFVLAVILYASFSEACDIKGENLYVLSYTPGPSWKPGVEIWEQDLKAHAHFMAELDAQGKMKLGGPFTDSTGGMAVLCLSSLEEARELLKKDPGVLSGVLSGQAKEWFIAFGK